MAFVPRVRSFWRNLVHRERVERDLDDELKDVFARLVDEKILAGQDPIAARRETRVALDGVEPMKERVRQVRVGAGVEAVLQDVRYAWGALRRSPGFSLTAIFSLAVGIGATTLVFSVVNAITLRPFPIDDPGRVLFIERHGAHAAFPHSFPQYLDLRERNETFADLAAYNFGFVAVDIGAGPVPTYIGGVTGNFFPLLGVRAHLGRTIQPEDDRPEATPVAVISWDFWNSAFNRSPAAIGTVIKVYQRAATIVGVAPKGFHGLEVTSRFPLWVPVRAVLTETDLANRRFDSAYVVGRLRPGVTRASADANVKAIARNLSQSFPETDSTYGVHVTEPGWLGDGFRTPIRAFAIALLVFGALVLLTACANLATTLTARTIDRHREIARMSLGAGRGRVVRLIAMETVLVALAGGAVAVAFTMIGANVLSNWSAPLEIPTQIDVRPDARVFSFAAGLSLAACFLCTIGPGRLLMRLQPNSALKALGPAVVGRRWAMRDVLVGVQVLFCCVLVAACLLSVIGLQQAFGLPLGFRHEQVASLRLEFETLQYAAQQRTSIVERAAEALSRLPGVERVAYASSAPLTAAVGQVAISIDGKTTSDTSMLPLSYAFNVSSTFFETMHVRLLYGRAFTDADSGDSPLVVVVNEAFARKFFGNANPIGQRFRVQRGRDTVLRVWEIVGVAADGKYRWLTESPQPALFFPAAQAGYANVTMLVRAARNDATLYAAMRRAIADLDPALPVPNVGPYARLMDLAFFPTRLAAIALTMFGALAVVLALNGMYGVVAHAVALRQREIALRVALGGGVWSVLRLLLGRMALIVVAAMVVGIGAAAALRHLLGQVVHFASPTDPTVLGTVVLVMLLVATAAMLGPAAKSLRIQPAVALRSE